MALNGLLSGLAAALASGGVLDKIAEREGQASVSDAWKAEALAHAKRAANLLEPVIAAVVGYYLAQALPNVQLDKEEPFSDSSLAGALSQVLGVPVASIKDRAALKAAFRALLSKKATEATGEHFEDVGDRALLKRDLLRAAGRHSSEAVPGLELRDFSDKLITREDCFVFGGRHLGDILGINFSDMRSKQAVKEDIYAWAMPQVRARLGDDANTDYKKPLKMDKKHIRNREAVRRFRAAHGSRQTYKSVDEG